MDYGRTDLADRLAAVYVAGTLRGAARRRFEALLPSHPALRSAVRLWEERLMPLTLAVEPVEPPASVWPRIHARISANGQAAPSTAGWWSRLALWRAFAGVATVAALSLAVLLSVPPVAQTPIIVVLSPAGAPAPTGDVIPASFVASISADGKSMVTKPLAKVALQPDRALELWSVPPEGAPRSLGVISASGATVVQRGRMLDNTAALAVTLEPPGGSPTGKATGPILYVGKLTL